MLVRKDNNTSVAFLGGKFDAEWGICFYISGMPLGVEVCYFPHRKLLLLERKGVWPCGGPKATAGRDRCLIDSVLVLIPLLEGRRAWVTHTGPNPTAGEWVNTDWQVSSLNGTACLSFSMNGRYEWEELCIVFQLKRILVSVFGEYTVLATLSQMEKLR